MMKNSAVVVCILLAAVFCMAGVPADEISKNKVLSAGPEWQEKYDTCYPNHDQAEAIKSKIGENLRIDIYLGLWCPDSINNVPPFLKIIDATGIAVPVRLFKVQRKPTRNIKYFVDQLQVERVPTFIFYRDNVEIGRIVENPKAGLAEDMMEILSK
jgi:hypothetical protein